MKTAFAFLFLFIGLLACHNRSNQLDIGMDQLYAWCIVPFDSKERSPQERIEMLSRLQFEQYAYDWREQHLDEMATEWELALENDIEVSSVWMWIDQRHDTIGDLNGANEKVFEALKTTGLKTQLWVSFHANFFEGLAQEEAVVKGSAMINYLCQRADSLSLGIGLYNHGDWFGEPQNQIAIIKALPDCNLGLIYNFHHGHHQVEQFDQLVDLMMPYLWAVNLNGMRKGGPKILPIGSGDLEQGMIQTLTNKGYDGPFGILGHVEERDVALVLKENLEGLSNL